MNADDQKLFENIATIIERMGMPFLSNINNSDPKKLSILFRDDRDLESLAIQIYLESVIEALAVRLVQANAIDELIVSGEIKTAENPDNLLNIIRSFVKECSSTGKWDELSIFYPLLNSLNKKNQAIPFVTDELSEKVEAGLKTVLSEIKLNYKDINFDSSYARKRNFLKCALFLEKDEKYKIFLKKDKGDNENKIINDHNKNKIGTEEIDNDSQSKWIGIVVLILFAFISAAGAKLISTNW